MAHRAHQRNRSHPYCCSATRAILPAGDQVFFATPLCIGFSPAHAKQTIDRLWSCGMLVYVHTVRGNGSALYAEGDDIADLMEMVAQEQNAANVRKSRNKP